MEILSAITKRRSVRAYKPDQVPEKVLNRLLEAARLAPSAHNLQNHKVIVVKDESKRQALAQASEHPWISQAPIVIVAIATNTDYIMGGGIPAYIVDTAIAIDHLTLQAAEEGLASCWIGTFNHEKIRGILQIPPEYKIVVLLPVGYADETSAKKPRKELQRLVCWESFC